MSVETPRQGGRLRVGIIGDGAAETLDPFNIKNTSDVARISNLFDRLYTVDRDNRTIPALVEEGIVNDDGTEWTFRLHSGVTFHDGKPLTADDVLWTIGLWTDPANAAVYAVTGCRIDAGRLRKLDELTVCVPLVAPNPRFPELLNWQWLSIFRDGDLPANARIGTGPFMYESFEPGDRSLFRRFPDYWGTEKPHVDELEIITSYTEDETRLRDLLDGRIDIAPILPFAAARSFLEGDQIQVLRRQGNSFLTFYMRVDQPPFDDPRIREALRLAVDREDLVETVLHGLGVVANDVPGRFCTFYADDLTRRRDVRRAAELVREAGYERLEVTLHTSTAVDGFVAAAEALQRHAREAHIDVELVHEPAEKYFDFETHYGHMPFAQSLWYELRSLQMTWATAFDPGSQLNETAWANPRTAELVAQATAERDERRAAELWRELQLEQHEKGGWIIWGEPENLDGLRPNVRGLRPSVVSYCDNFEFCRAWLDGA